MNSLGFTELIILIVIAFLIVLPLWKICSKAGFSPWLSLLIFIPLINILLFYYLAFTEWPVNRETKQPAID